MRQAQIIEGQVYHYVDNRGKHGVVLTGRKVRVERKGINRSNYSSRMDGIRVTFLIEQDGQLVDEIRHDGEPHQRILTAREIMGDAEYETERMRQEAMRVQRELMQQEMLEYKQAREVVIAQRLGISDTEVAVFANRVDVDGVSELRTRSANITGTAVEEIMNDDPDVELIAAAIREIPRVEFRRMTPEQQAERIVHGMRNGHSDE